VAGQICQRSDPSELAHALRVIAIRAELLSHHEGGFPESQRTMTLEGSHVAKISFVHEKRHAPLERFLYLGTALMDQIAYVRQDRFCKISRAGNIRIHTRIFGGHVSGLKVGWSKLSIEFPQASTAIPRSNDFISVS